MPIIKIKEKIVYFAHIPKCAGQSIENYFRAIGLPLAFLDEFHISKPSNPPWNKTSPQHITGDALARLFPKNFFDIHFTVVRHPYERLTSAFRFQKYVEKKIKQEESINSFVKNTLRSAAKKGNTFDNHFLPQLDFLMPGQTISFFKIEHGVARVKQFIDEIALTRSRGIDIGHSNKRTYPESDVDDISSLDMDSLEIVRGVYEQDFIKFTYNP